MSIFKTQPKSIIFAAVDEDTAKSIASKSILGTFEGECADANITNENGMDITREVWETVFESEEYQKAIKLGWYIGFLGHPEDPNCMDFEHACIVMREGYIAEDGKVYGKFDLIDTNVGRIVKAFIDAGVTFGISVRGVGDIENNSVDPDTFIFRGFDLVTFPAYPEAIPEFSEIAASTDLNKRKAYKKVCAAVDANIEGVNTVEAVNILQSHFAPQSEEYKKLEARKAELSDAEIEETDEGIKDDEIAILGEKVDAVTELYLEQLEANTQLSSTIECMKREHGRDRIAASRKLAAVKRISGSQVKRINAECERFESENKGLKKEITAAQQSNLIYKHEITANRKELKQKDAIIATLKSEHRKTVTASKKIEAAASNRDEENKRLEAQVLKANTALEDFKVAYAKIYASAYGVSLTRKELEYVRSSINTTSELEDYIAGATNTANVGVAPFVEPTPVVIDDEEQFENLDELVTL